MPETRTSIVLLRLSNTKPNGTLKTSPNSIQLNSRAEIPGCVKIKQLQTKLMSTAATEIKLLSAFHRCVNNVITAELNNGARRISHGTTAAGVSGPLNTRTDAKTSEVNMDRFSLSGDEALVFHFGIMAEVHEQTECAAGCAEIVQQLRAMLIGQGRDGFDFDNDRTVTNEVRHERLNERTAILQGLRRF